MKPVPSAGKSVTGTTTVAKRRKTLACVADGNFSVYTVNIGKILVSATQARRHVTAAAGPKHGNVAGPKQGKY